MATTDQLVAKAKRILSRRNSTEIDTDILAELALAQERLEQEAQLPDFLYAYQTISATGDIDLETELTRYLRLYEKAGGITYEVNDPGDGEPYLKLKRYDEREQLLQLYPGSMGAGATVRGYFMADTLVTLRPSPSVSVPQNLKIHFYQGEANLPLAGNSNLWTQKAGDYLLGSAGIVIAETLRDNEALGLFRGLEAAGKARLFKKLLGDEQADQEYVMGDRD